MFKDVKKLVMNGLFVLLIFISFGMFIYYHRISLNNGLFYLQEFLKHWSWGFVLHNIQELILLIILILSAGGIGCKILKLFKINFNNVLEEFIFSIGSGLGFFSLITLGLGLAGMLFPLIFYPVVLCAFFISYVEIRYFLLHWYHILTMEFKTKFNIRGLIILCSIGIIILLGMILNIGGPPILFDVLVYHLAIPDIYLKNHRISEIPYLLFSNYPLNVEMLFTIALGLKSDILAQLIHFSFGLLSGLSIYTLSKTYFSQKHGLIALLVFFSMPSIIFTMSFAFNDLGLTYYVILAVYAMLNWIRINDKKWLFLSGVMVGLAMGVKYTGVICFTILFGVIIMTKFKTPIKAIKELSIFSFMALLPVLPWLIKNLIFVGNPVYPFFYEFFGGDNWSDFNARRFIQEMTHYGPPYSGVLRYLSLPFFITCEWRTGDIPIGPLFLLYLPFLFFIKNMDKTIKYLLIFCSFYFFIWASTSIIVRFLFPCIALLCVIVGYVIIEMKKSPFFEIPVAFAIILNIYTLATAIGQHPYFYLQDNTREEKLLLAAPVKDYYNVVKFINEKLPDNSKILFIGEPRRYYCEKEVLTSSQLDTAIISKLVKESNNTTELLHKLKDLKVTHILYNKSGIIWLKRQFNYFNWENKTQASLYESFMNLLHPIYVAGDVYLYKIPECRNSPTF